MRKFPFLAVLVAALLLTPSTALAGGDDRAAAAMRGLDHLRGIQDVDGCIGSPSASAWAAIAFARAGIDPQTVALPGGASLEACVIAETRPIGGTVQLLDVARQVLALVASGADPRTAPGFDAVQEILDGFVGGQLGSPDLLNDDIFGLMALHAAGVPNDHPAVQGAMQTVIQNQLPSGAWSFGTWMPPNANSAFAVLFADVDMTGAAIVALTSVGLPQGEHYIVRGLGWMRANQELLTGGCAWNPLQLVFAALDPTSLLSSQGNTDSTSWGAMGVVASGGDPGAFPWQTPTGESLISFLQSMQQPDGSFAWMEGNPGFSPESTTANAVLALLGHTWVA